MWVGSQINQWINNKIKTEEKRLFWWQHFIKVKAFTRFFKEKVHIQMYCNIFSALWKRHVKWKKFLSPGRHFISTHSNHFNTQGQWWNQEHTNMQIMFVRINTVYPQLIKVQHTIQIQIFHWAVTAITCIKLNIWHEIMCPQRKVTKCNITYCKCKLELTGRSLIGPTAILPFQKKLWEWEHLFRRR